MPLDRVDEGRCRRDTVDAPPSKSKNTSRELPSIATTHHARDRERCDLARTRWRTHDESTASREREIAQSSEERCCGLSIIVTITIIFLIIMKIIINDIINC